MESLNTLSVLLTTIAGMVMAFLFEYVPGFMPWYQKRTKQEKKLIMLGLLVVAAVISVALACWSPFEVGVTCSSNSFWDLLAALFLSLGIGAGANQSIHRLIRRDE